MADFRINVIVDPSRVPQGTRVVERELVRVENRADNLRRTLGLTFGALAGGAVVFGAVRAIARFEESIATAQAVTKATTEQFEQLRDRALELGITTRFSATQAADALVLLARAGFSVDEALTAVGDTLLLAQAGGLGLAEAADIAANSLRGFNLQASETARVADVLLATSNAANTNVSELGQAMKFVAPIAAGLNQSIEATSAALGVLADAGLKATLGGTGLRRVLAELESPGRELNALLKEAGLTADEVAPSQNDLVDVLERLKRAGIDTGTALEVFGQRGGPAFQVLVSNIPKLEELTGGLNKAGGEAKRVADIMDNTLNGALLRARSAIEGTVLALGEVGASDFLIVTLDAISAGFRFAADNAGLLQVALVALSAGGVAVLASNILTKLLPAMRVFTLSLVLARGNVIALAADWLKLNAAVAIGPFVAVAAAVAAATASLQFQSRILKDIEESVANLEQDAGFARIGVQIRQAAQELKTLEAAVKAQSSRGFGASDAQIARIEKLKQTIADLRGEVREQTEAERERQEREARGADITDGTITRLERRGELLRALTREQQASAAFQEELNRLEEQGALPNTTEKERIRALIEENEKLAVQQRIFEEIKGPQEEFRQNQEALQALFDKGAISAGEYAAKLQELQDAQAPTEIEQTLNALEQLQAENVALADRIRLGDAYADKVALENQLREQGVEITREIQDQINEEIEKKRALTEQQEKLNEAQRQARQDAQREQRDIERLAERINVQNQVLEQERLLNEARAQGLITSDQYAESLADLQLRGLEASTALEDGFARAFAKISREAEDLAAVGEKVVNVFADNATDALVKFVETGQFNFKEFANSILSDLTRIIARLLIVQALNAVFGGGVGTAAGAAASGAASGAFADGGTTQPGRSYLVGENGPELFMPDRTGAVVPNHALQPQQEQQPITVQVVNVQSEDDIPNAINNGGADEAIINAIARNKDRVNQVTQ